MVKIIEESKISVASFEEDGAKKGIKVSGGYLRKAAKNGTNIGIDLVDYFLDRYPEINPGWLLKGVGNIRMDEEKHTAATKPIEAAVKSLADSIAKLTEANFTANQTIAKLLSGEVVKQG